MRATMTRYESLPRVHPPSQVTRQSPKYDPSVTGVFKRRNLVSICMCRAVGLDTVIAHKLRAVKWYTDDQAPSKLVDFMGSREPSCPL